MNFADAVQTVFPDVRRDLADYPGMIGTIQCCGVSVVMDSHSGTPTVYCLKCGNAIEQREGAWRMR